MNRHSGFEAKAGLSLQTPEQAAKTCLRKSRMAIADRNLSIAASSSARDIRRLPRLEPLPRLHQAKVH
jgi:hypothetical protein